MNQSIEQFQCWFEKKSPLKGKNSRIVRRENTREDNANVAKILPNQKIYSMFQHDKKAKIGVACIGYGYGYGTVPSFANRITITHQNHYEDTPLWHMDISGCLGEISQSLDISASAEQQEAALNGELIRWMVQPQGNQEIADDIFKIMIYPILSAVCDRIPGRAHKEIDLVLPLISETLDEPNWEQLLGSFRLDNTQVRIHPYAHLMRPESGERIYSFVVHRDREGEYCIADVIEQAPSGEPVSIGAYAFTQEMRAGEYIPLKNIRERTVEISAAFHRRTPIAIDNAIDTEILTECKLKEISSLKSFLGTHAPSFYKAFFTAKEGTRPINSVQAQISELLSNRRSLQTEQICAKLCNADNLLHISLSDMVTVASLLEDRRYFRPTTIEDRGHTAVLDTQPRVLGRQEVPLQRLPSNYGAITWECTTRRYTPEDYGNVSTEQLEKMNLDDKLSMMICYFSPACTEEIAEELLFIHHKKGAPTARFVAELFWHLLQSDQFRIKSKSAPVQNYQILETKNEVVTEYRDRNKNPDHAELKRIYNMSLDELGLSLKTQSILRRAGIRKVGDLACKSEVEMSKIRNLGAKSRLEIQKALGRYGIQVAKQ